MSVDLSSDEDLIVGIMNLISIEEHLFFTHVKTGDDKYLAFLNDIRALRTSLLKRVVTNPEGETWCISKHLLASSMRLMEVGTKELKKGNGEDTKKLFAHAFDLISYFFAINLKGKLPPPEDNKAAITGIKGRIQNIFSKGSTSGFREELKKAMNCCDEDEK